MTDHKETNSKEFDGEALRISVVIKDLQSIMERYGDVGVWFDEISSIGAANEYPVEAVKPSFIEGKIQALLL